MRKIPKVYLILVLAASYIIFSDIVVMKNKVLYGGDEIITYLCATGNSGAFENVIKHRYPYGELVGASEYKRFFEIKEPFCYRKIASDLCTNDLHPPLYFWLLHLFVLNLGVHIYTGILLNLLLQLISLFLIFRLAMLIFKDSTKASVAAFTWTISPATIGVAFNARQYELLTVVSVIYFLNFFYWQRKQVRLNALLLVVTGVAGMLTHYSFMYVIGACGLYSIWYFRLNGWRQIFVFSLSGLLAFGIMTLVQPCFYDSFMLQEARNQDFSPADLPIRIGKIILAYIQFYLPVFHLKEQFIKLGEEIMQPYFKTIIGLIIIVLTACMYLIVKNRNSLRKFIQSHFFNSAPEVRFAVFNLISLTLAIIIPYLLFITPYHAMGGHYLSYLYPLIAIVTAQFFPSKNKSKIIFIVILMAGSLSVLYSMVQENDQSYVYLIDEVKRNKIIVVNNCDRRAFPRLIPYLRNDQKILLEESAVYENDSLMNQFLSHKSFLMIYGDQEIKGGEKFGVQKHNYYKTNDGIEFNTAEIRIE